MKRRQPKLRRRSSIIQAHDYGDLQTPRDSRLPPVRTGQQRLRDIPYTTILVLQEPVFTPRAVAHYQYTFVTMADRFPSIEDIDAGTTTSPYFPHQQLIYTYR
jgi:hypothetical protein